MNEAKWYCARGEDKKGPFPWEKLCELAASGHLAPSDLVWTQGMAKWLPAAQVEGLLTSATPPVDTPTDQLLRDSKAVASSAARVASGAMHQGAKRASKMVTEGAARLRKGLGGSVLATIGYGLSALRLLLRHPFSLSFITLMFLIAVWVSLAGIVTAVLFPMFTMGYLTVLNQKLNHQPLQLGAFIGFMRYGWNALWHLFMMLASFIVMLSLMIAPLLMLLAVLYLAGGTLAAVYGMFGGFSLSGEKSVSRLVETGRAIGFLREQRGYVDTDAGRERIDNWIKEMQDVGDKLAGESQDKLKKSFKELGDKDLAAKQKREEEQKTIEEERKKNAFPLAEEGYKAWQNERFVSWQKSKLEAKDQGEGVFATLWQIIKAFFWRLLLLLVIAIGLFPLCSAVILFFYLIYDVSTKDPESQKGFNLVYDSFAKTLNLGGLHWKEVATNGLFVAIVFAGSLFLMGLILALLTSLGMVTLAGWFLTVFVPLYWFACTVYLTVFMAMVCLKLREQFGNET